MVEVMIASAVLSVGAVLIFESFFILLDYYGYCSNYLNAVHLLDQKVWDAQDALFRLGSQAQLETRGVITKRHKVYAWDLSYGLIDETAGLYTLDLIFSWTEGRKKIKLLRTAYVQHKKDEQ